MYAGVALKRTGLLLWLCEGGKPRPLAELPDEAGGDDGIACETEAVACDFIAMRLTAVDGRADTGCAADIAAAGSGATASTAVDSWSISSCDAIVASCGFGALVALVISILNVLACIN